MEFTNQFLDKRLKRNSELLFNRIVERKVVNLRKLSNGRSEAVKFERLLANENISIDQLITAEQNRIRDAVLNRHVLAIQDTSELNYQKHAGRVKGLGIVGNGKDKGFFIHPMLILDAETESCLGFSDIHIENRLNSSPGSYKKLPIEEKESYRWVKTAQKSKRVLSRATTVTIIGDRENDVYEYFDRIPDDKAHVITRIRSDRMLANGGKLYAYLDQQQPLGVIDITVPREIRNNREERIAQLTIKCGEVEIKKPRQCTDKSASKKIGLHIVEAKETNCPVGQKPIHWRIFTTHLAKNFIEAKQIILWYRCRWNIEQVFRIMKKQGLNIESSQVESATGLMKLAIMALCASIKIMQLVRARDGSTEQKTSDVFELDEHIMLSTLLKRFEGKTLKQKNPYPQENLAWASWIIARLGGWKGYTKSEGFPGPIVIGRGLEMFYGIYDGWKMHRDLCAE
jgi:hypothetical protein